MCDRYMVGSINSHRNVNIKIMGYVLPSFGLSSAQIASSLNRYARITLSFTDDLPSKIASKSDKAN